jgi:hypothetical protein
MNNLAAAPEHQDRRAALEAQLLAKLKEQEDPRMSGQGDVFDNYPYAGRRARACMSAISRARKSRPAGSIPPTTSPAPLEDNGD